MSYVNIQNRRLPFVIRYLADLITYRHLCWNLVASDLRARFRRTRLGILWAIIQPLAFALLIAAVWGSLHQSATYWEFALYVFSGMIVWEFFSNVVIASQDTLIGAQGYLKQRRIPFLIFQLRVPLTSAVIFFFGIVGLGCFELALGALPAPGLHLLLVPAFFAILILFTIPIAIVMSVLGTHYRDVRHISGLAVQALFFVSPIMLARSILEQPQLRFMEFVNPMISVLDLFRDPALYGRMWQEQDILVVSIWGAALWGLAIIASVSAGRRLVFAV